MPRANRGEPIPETVKAFATDIQKKSIDAVNAAGGNRAAAARALGLPATTVREHIQLARRAAANGIVSKKGRNQTGPHAPRGPSDKPRIPEGHELAGLSTLRDMQTGDELSAWEKTRIAGAEVPPVEPEPPGFLINRVSTYRRGDGSTIGQWTSADREKETLWNDCQEAVRRHVAEYVTPAPPILLPALTDHDPKRRVAYCLGDPHIGLLAWWKEVGRSFDLRIAEDELCECFRQLVARSPRTETAYVVNLGDFWHAQDDKQQTPRGGNKLDVDGRTGKVGEVGLRIFRTIIDTARQHHKRTVVRSIPGNHDPVTAFWLPQTMRALYSNAPDVEIEDAYNPYQFDRFGEVLLGWCHGDGAKLEALGEIMSVDARQDWGSTQFHYWNTGHVHHWSQKELRGCFVDTHRTLASRDAWHHHAGYRSGQALKATVYHCDWGYDGQAAISVERVRAALGVAA